MASKKTNYPFIFKVTAVLLPLISFVHLLFPRLIKRKINEQLKKLGEVQGRMDSLTMSKWGRELNIRGLHFTNYDETRPVPFKFAEIVNTTVTLNPARLWRGVVELEIKTDGVILYFLKSEDGVHSLFHSLGSSQAPFPVIIRSAKISGVEVNYLDTSVKPGVELKTETLNLVATNISNVPSTIYELPSQVKVTCSACSGYINIDLKGDFAAEKPRFDLNAEIKDIDLTRLNSLLLSYAKFDVNQGTLNLFVEVAAAEGRFKGYIKPAILNLDVLNKDDLHKGLVKVIWAGLVGGALSVISNPFKKELATKIPFSGTLNNPKMNVAHAVFEVLYNAFVQSLHLSLDDEITLDSVKYPD